MEFIVAFSLFSSQENLYMIHHDLDLFYDIYNSITEVKQRQTIYFLILFLNHEKVLYNFMCFITNALHALHHYHL